jgi:hypothetical protein
MRTQSKPGFWLGLFSGFLLTFPLVAIFYLDYLLAALPFPPFHLFDLQTWILRVRSWDDGNSILPNMEQLWSPKRTAERACLKTNMFPLWNRDFSVTTDRMADHDFDAPVTFDLTLAGNWQLVTREPA